MKIISEKKQKALSLEKIVGQLSFNLGTATRLTLGMFGTSFESRHMRGLYAPQLRVS